VKGIVVVSVRFSKCCSPVPGDEIVGFVTRGRGVSVHRTDCINVINMSEIDRARLIGAEWQAGNGENKGKYITEIAIYANNRIGILVDISKIMTEQNLDVLAMNSRVSKQGVATVL
jgi:GTP pyrophosphokinase